MPHTYQEGIGTACTNGKRVLYDPKFVSGLSDDELKFLVAHECMHPMLEHNFRRQSRDPKKWNMAADYVINQLLTDEGIGRFIDGGCLNKDLYTAGGGMSEQIYNLLPDSNDDGEGGDGPGGTGMDLEDGEGTATDQAQQAAEWKVKVAQAAQAAKMMGKLSAGMARLVDAILNPTVDWREALQKFVVKHKTDERSFARPNRRFLSQGLYMPSRSGEIMGEMAFLVDCSGSVDDKQLAQMAAEIRTVHEDMRPEKLHVVYFDSTVSHYECYGPDDSLDIRFHGGGGTDVRAAFNYLDDEALSDNLVCTVVLTDGYTPYPDGCNTPVIWAMTTNEVAPFGEHCRVTV
jgi:predicted metal-dependent peptidase